VSVPEHAVTHSSNVLDLEGMVHFQLLVQELLCLHGEEKGDLATISLTL